MFILFGEKSSVKTVRGGRRVVSECPSCGVTAQFHECERKQTLNVYVVLDLLTDKTTVFRCTNCGDVFELDERAAAAAGVASEKVENSAKRTRAAAKARARSERKAREQAEKLRRQREREALAAAERRKRAARQKERQIEDELAALKRKLDKR